MLTLNSENPLLIMDEIIGAQTGPFVLLSLKLLSPICSALFLYIVLTYLLFHLGFDPGLRFCFMQIRRSLLNEDEYGFRKARRPIYYDEGLEVITFS